MIQAEAPDPRTLHLTRTIGDHRGAVDGPTLVIIGGVHANEPAGIDAALRVHGSITRKALRLNAGRLVSLRGNLTGLRSISTPRRRYIDEDLNRAFTTGPDHGGRGGIEHIESAELSDAIESIARPATHPVFLLDLHTVSSDSPPFVVFEDSLEARRFASFFPLPKVLGLEEELRGLLVDHATQKLGCISCIAESGRHDDPRSVDVHEALVLIALRRLRMVTPHAATSSGEDPRVVANCAAGRLAGNYYDVRQRFEIAHESFTMMPDAVAFSRVRAGRTVLATEHDRPITADADGLLFMPNRQRERRPGDDGFFIVERVGWFWLALSAALRRGGIVHRLAPTLLPGVRRRHDDPHTIVIAPEYAAVLRREILHLFGYRLVHWHHTPYLSRGKRALAGARALGRSLSKLLASSVSGGERAALPAERDSDWLARRHSLDVTPPQPHSALEHA